MGSHKDSGMSDSDTDHDLEMREMETQELLSEYERLVERLHACVEEMEFRYDDDVVDSITNSSNKMPVKVEDMPGDSNDFTKLLVAVRNVAEADK